MTDISRVADALSGRYRIERELGAGGMATVYLARDLKHDREVAIKVLRPELAAVLGAERFLAEVRITAGLDHPHILTLIDSGESGGLPYYVLPFVRGESLRARLERERQLPIDDAVRIARQLASALDYAHRQGVVHRDIKPENILFHEDEAVLADFGIALAVKEAGGNRLTETGLSLGTPQYMSPEQASGDRNVDARSDIYSLGAVFYEMLAGEPPTTGPSVQAIIAKLMTERPTRLRVVRDTVPAAIDAAVDKALAKVPADRFSSAGAFAAALDAGVAHRPRQNRRALTVGLTGAGIMALVVISAWAVSRRSSPQGHVSPTDARQLTFTGNVEQPAISPDGKQLAYFERGCVDGSCAYSVEVQDIGSIVPRRLLEHVTYPSSLTWSPDRRNLLVWATLAGHFGAYLVSAASGATRFVMPEGDVDFFAGGDSLLVAPAFHPDTAFMVRVTSLDGIVGDSIRIAGPGVGIGPVMPVPHSRWIAAMVLVRPERFALVILDRAGRVAQRVEHQTRGNNYSSFVLSNDALWLQLNGATGSTLVRIAIDTVSGHLATRWDTVAVIPGASDVSVTGDGSAMVTDVGTYEYSQWAVPFADAMAGRLPDARRVLRASTVVDAIVSPDGGRIILRRFLPVGTRLELEASVIPFAGGPEVPLPAARAADMAGWADSVHVAISRRTPEGLRESFVDVRSGVVDRTIDIPDSLVTDLTTFRDGVAWISATNDEIVVKRAGTTVRIPKPISHLYWINATMYSRRIGFAGTNAAGDTVRFGTVPDTGGTPTIWAAIPGLTGKDWVLADGGLLCAVFDATQTLILYRIAAPGRIVAIGALPRRINSIRVSSDLSRAAVGASEFHGDAWMSKLIRR